jgi:hypothetical protein
MNKLNLANEKGRDAMNEIENKGSELLGDAKRMMDKSAATIKESSNDWLDYVKDHPLQTMFYGIVTFFAIKGFFKE